MITIIFGAPGSGKTSLNAHFLIDTYRREGRKLLKDSRKKIEAANMTRAKPLSLPEKPPIFSDFKVKFRCGYEKFFEPYFINGYYFGMANEIMATQYLPPYSKIFLSEGQKYFDSRQNTSFPTFVSNAFEMHRHYGIDIFIDVQRPGLIDLNIRALCKRFIEVVEMQHEKSGNDAISKTRFLCREFDSNVEVESFVKNGEGCYTETEYVHEGNIFRCFDSRGHYEDFLPTDGKDFNLLPFLGKGENPPTGSEIFYKTSEPKEYRMKRAPTKQEKTEKTEKKETV